MPSRTLDRRTFLKASGVAMALPWLETLARANPGIPPAPARMVNIGATLGLYSDAWFPKNAGADYEASEYLALIDRHRSRYTLFSGLGHANQSGRQAHNSEITWLTSAEHPGLDGFQNTISLDQAAADHVGYVTRASRTRPAASWSLRRSARPTFSPSCSCKEMRPRWRARSSA